MNWTLSKGGKTASRTRTGGEFESCLIEALSPEELANATPADAPTQAEIAEEMSTVVQTHLDATAKTKGYDSILSACSYAGAPNPFQAESVKFITWRGAVWAKCYEVLAACQGGAPIPTEAELIAALPAFVG